MKIRTTVLTVALLASSAIPLAYAAEDAAPKTDAPAAAAATAAAPAATPVPGAADADKAKEQGQPEVTADLSPEKAKIYNDAMKKAAESNKDLRAQIRKAHEEADAILVADKFDKDAFLAKAAELDKLYAKQRESMNAAFISVVEKFSKEDRQILLKARNERRRRMIQG